jgi:lipoprotein-anchoring transpeptidase ErfK/SrfK
MLNFSRTQKGVSSLFLGLFTAASFSIGANASNLYPPPLGMQVSKHVSNNLTLHRKENIPTKYIRQVVPYKTSQPVGTIIVNTAEKHLYLVLKNGYAMRYGIGVGRVGFEWSGTHRLTAKKKWPGWTPPAAMRKRQPELPKYMKGGIKNPLGARALYIGSTLYRLHGTTEPWSIGKSVSSGCIRLTNQDITDLYNRARVGAKIVVL